MAATSNKRCTGGGASFASFGDNALTWDRVACAAAYVILVADPYAAMPKPFVHWVAWNIPEPMTPEGLEETIHLSNAITQGRTSRGSVGYSGPTYNLTHR